MFAGIIERVGKVVSAASAPRTRVGGAQAHPLVIELGALADGLALGASVAVNGVCLTLAGLDRENGTFDVVPETWSRSTLRALAAGDPVNLERSLRMGAPIDGHLVQGHVEGVGTVDRIDRGGGQWKLWVRVPAGLMAAIIPKGSIAIDGTSLTVVDVLADRCSVALVPTTLERTVLGSRAPGSPVNIETDLLARTVIQRLENLGLAASPAAGRVTIEALRAAGFVS